jgi:glycerophosphoryl diester phosphodiesterase
VKINNKRIYIHASINKILVVLFLISLLFIVVQLIPVNKQSNTSFLKAGSSPLVIAHRGGAGLAPENTIRAFKLSEQLGVDAVELDVRMTKDEQIVVIHDEKIDRTTNGTGYVSDYTLAELKRFDAGYRLKLEGGGYPFRNKGISIPTLEEVFQQITNTNLVIELKDSNPKVEKKVAKLIKDYNLKKRVIVGSFNDNSLKRFANRTKGKVPIGTGIRTLKYYIFLHKVHLDRLYPLNRHAVQIPVKVGSVNLATKRFVETLRERKIAIHYWTINDVDTMKKLIDINVDGIITDYPNKLLKIVGESKDKGEI